MYMHLGDEERLQKGRPLKICVSLEMFVQIMDPQDQKYTEGMPYLSESH